MTLTQKSQTQFPQVFLYLHLALHQICSSWPDSEMGSLMRNTTSYSQSSQADTSSTRPGSKSPQGSRISSQIKAEAPGGGPQSRPHPSGLTFHPRRLLRPSPPYSIEAQEAWERILVTCNVQEECGPLRARMMAGRRLRGVWHTVSALQRAVPPLPTLTSACACSVQPSQWAPSDHSLALASSLLQT